MTMAEEEQAAGAVAPVWVNVYHVGHAKAVARLDNVLSDVLGVGGIYHAAVQIGGAEFGKPLEWSFGATPSRRTGVFHARPRQCRMHTFKEAVYMGDCKLGKQTVIELLRQLRKEWMGTDYDLLHKNCCSFCDTLCERLGVGRIPRWIHRLADIGASFSDAQASFVRGLHVIEEEVVDAEHAMVAALHGHCGDAGAGVDDSDEVLCAAEPSSEEGRRTDQ